MKELSIEEKAKAYDEALKYAMIYYKDGNEDMKMMMKTCFPVLVEESEDERIRKDIVSFINGTRFTEPNTEERLEWLSWLKKQGEKGTNGNEREIPFSEQKPAWSEEDMEMIGNIRRIIEQYAFYNSAVDVNGELCEKEYIDADSWLKNLKDRVLPQPKQEWSEDDETVVNSIISFCDFKVNIEQHNEGVKEVSKKVLSWLNELKYRVQPQSTWKPSDEQMGALDDVISSRDIKYDVLSELWNNLKKLREE